ncbi:MAG: serine/threonine protein kinase [Sandaracinaceae bacterium]|nr:serine/threonine protein kinase [Sandaracinaceae bacterium]
MASRFRRCAHCGLSHERDLTVCPFTGRPIDPSVASASEPPAEGEDPILGRLLDGRYQVEALVGRGGMGAVYRAMNLRIEKPVAIKVLSGDGAPVAVSRFMREARAAARVVHENVVGIYDVGALPDETPFLVMELLEGESLEERLLHAGALDLAEAVGIATQILSGLEAVHASGAIHRDVKPANVFLARTLDGETAKLLDFGLSKTVEDSRLTRPGEVVGTPSYLAPEQARGLADLDARSTCGRRAWCSTRCSPGRRPSRARPCSTSSPSSSRRARRRRRRCGRRCPSSSTPSSRRRWRRAASGATRRRRRCASPSGARCAAFGSTPSSTSAALPSRTRPTR